MLFHFLPGDPLDSNRPPRRGSTAPTVSLAGLQDLLQALADEGLLDQLPPLARLFAAELAELLEAHLGGRREH